MINNIGLNFPYLTLMKGDPKVQPLNLNPAQGGNFFNPNLIHTKKIITKPRGALLTEKRFILLTKAHMFDKLRCFALVGGLAFLYLLFKHVLIKKLMVMYPERFELQCPYGRQVKAWYDSQFRARMYEMLCGH
jgi:hypothetical protein